MVMGGESLSKGCEFESWHRILDGHFQRHLREIDCSSALVGGPAAGTESGGKSIP